MQHLFDFAFARLDRAGAKRREFSEVWNDYVSAHPWEIDVRAVGPCRFEVLAVMREPAPIELSMVFSEWLAALRAALDNGLYAWVAAATGQNPPPRADRLQYPVCTSPEEFRKQEKRLWAVPRHIVEALEKSQPYQSPYGPESNLTYWIHELARTDRHRTPHVGLGRIDEHRIRIALPEGTSVEFDETVEPYRHIEHELVVARFTTGRPLTPKQIRVDLRGVTIAPEILAWADFRMGDKSATLWDRMVYTELFTRNHLENMALMGGALPPEGFKTFTPNEGAPTISEGPPPEN